jgi:hypothetical protein
MSTTPRPEIPRRPDAYAATATGQTSRPDSNDSAAFTSSAIAAMSASHPPRDCASANVASALTATIK